MISLTSPIMLLGMAAAALPVVAHLMNRRARRQLTFPTVRLLAEASASQSRLFRMRRWLLLALRCLAVALIVLAFAQPVWVDAQTPSAGSGAGSGAGADGAAVVIVIDASASTAQQSGGVNLFHRMRAAAGDVLDELEPGRDVANLIFAAAQPRAAFPEPIHNLDALRSDLREMQPTQQRADLSTAIAMAHAMLAPHPGPRRLVVLSDMQRTNWTGDPLAAASAPGPAPDPDQQPIRVTVLPIGDEDDAPSNIALSRPTVFPAQPVASRPARLSVTVTNHAGHPRSVTVDAAVDGQPIGSRTFQLAARQQRNVAFDAAFHDAQPHRVVFSTQPDDLTLDNHAYLVADVVNRIPIVVVGDDDPAEPTGSSYFLHRALAPRGNETDALLVRHVTSDNLTAASLAGAQAVLVGDVGPLSLTALTALRDYIARGGGVLLFSGQGPVAQNATALANVADEAPLLPWRPIARRNLGTQNKPLRITGGAWSAPPLSAFDAAAREALHRVVFTRVYTTSEPTPTAFTLLRYGDGTPALSVQPFGAGQLMLANFSPSPQSSNLAKHGVFVALLHGLIDALQPRRDPSSPHTPGHPITYTTPSNPPAAADTARFTVVHPDGDVHPIDAAAVSGQLQVQLPRPARTGFYTIERDGQPITTLAVNLDPRESDLRRIDPAALNSRLADDDAAVARVSGTSWENQPTLHLRGRPLWPWLIVAAMAAIGAELLLLSVWRR